MTLWLLMTVLCSATAVVMSIPLIRRYEDQSHRVQDQAIYQDQLDEVDRDQAAGTIDAPEAKAARVEISRRLAVAETTIKTPQPLSPGWKRLALVSTAALVILGGVNLYSYLGTPELQSVSNLQPPTSAVPPAQDDAAGTGQIDTVIQKLEARLQTNPNDGEGWRTLGWARFNKQDYAAAADAYAKAVSVEPTNIEYRSAYAEALVQAAAGIVTPKAQGLIAEVLAKDPKNFRARFYDSLAHEQAGDQAGALDRWMALLAASPEGAGWREDVKARITSLGKAMGRDVSAIIGSAAPVISDEQKTAIQALPATDQMAMIKGMVAKLADRLKANPNDPDGWIKLIKSYLVLNDIAAAKDALSKALVATANDPANRVKIATAAADLGLK
jgi:cytochrome c-type biogenesis protein CcmH